MGDTDRSEKYTDSLEKLIVHAVDSEDGTVSADIVQELAAKAHAEHASELRAEEQPVYRFKGRATGRDPEGYYYVRWDRARPLSVLANTNQDANKKAWKLLGKHPRFGSWRDGDGSGWTLIWDSIDEEVA